MSVRVRSVVRFLAECTEPECTWRQLHDDYDRAIADAKRHRREWHPRPGDEDGGMTFPIEAEAAALAQRLLRVDPHITADLVDSMSILDRLLTASIAGVDATDAHWVLVRKLVLAHESSEEPACP